MKVSQLCPHRLLARNAKELQLFDVFYVLEFATAAVAKTP